MLTRKTCAFAVIAIAFAVTPVFANSAGIYNQSSIGCTCHAPVSTNVLATTSPGALTFVPGMPLDVDVTVMCTGDGCPSGDRGGFNISSSAGPFLAGDGSHQVRNIAASRQATHTSTGNQQRAWTVLWQPPNDCTTENATLSMSANAVNGNGQNSGDAWDIADAVTVTRAAAIPGTTPAVTIVQPLPNRVYVGNTSFPSPGPTMVTGTIQLQATATDDAGIASVTFYDGSVLIGTGNRSVADGTLFMRSWTPILRAGQRTIKATALDCEENSTTATIDVIVID